MTVITILNESIYINPLLDCGLNNKDLEYRNKTWINWSSEKNKSFKNHTIY